MSSYPWTVINTLQVAAVFLSDTLHQILITHTVYTYLITNFGDLVALNNLVWSIVAMVLVNGLTAAMVQSFMTLRVWKLTNGSYALTGLVSALVLGEFIAIIYFSAKAFQLGTFTQLPLIKGASISVNVLGAAGDVLIALILCSMLQQSRTGFRKSETVINRLTIFTINTGLMTSLCAVASLVSIVAAPNAFIYIAFFVNLGRLYSNTLLATLNARQSIRNTLDNTTISLSGLKQGATSMGNSQRRSNNIAIKVDTTQEYSEERQYSDGEFLDTNNRKIGGTIV